jgi:hypothetical protein
VAKFPAILRPFTTEICVYGIFSGRGECQLRKHRGEDQAVDHLKLCLYAQIGHRNGGSMNNLRMLIGASAIIAMVSAAHAVEKLPPAPPCIKHQKKSETHCVNGDSLTVEVIMLISPFEPHPINWRSSDGVGTDGILRSLILSTDGFERCQLGRG